jgi:hypothetical protein
MGPRAESSTLDKETRGAICLLKRTFFINVDFVYSLSTSSTAVAALWVRYDQQRGGPVENAAKSAAQGLGV